MFNTQIRKGHLKHPICIFKCQPLHILKAQKQNRVLIHPFRTERSMLHDIKPGKQFLAISPYIKEALHHAHRESFSEAAWTSEQGYRIIRIMYKFIQQLGFIHIITVIFSQPVKKFSPDSYTNSHDDRPPS